MRRFLLILAAVPCTFALGQGLASWGEFKSEVGKFSVEMPSKPSKVTQPVETKIGRIDLTLYISVPNPEYAFGAGYADFPADKAANLTTDMMLDGARTGLLNGGTRSLKNEKVISLDGVPGREFNFAGMDGKYGIVRIYLAKGRLYEQLVVWGKYQPATDELTHFLSSFKIQ